MPNRARKSLPNPFYVLVLLSSTAFAVTALAYYISPNIEQAAIARPEGGPVPESKALAAWFDRHGPTTLAAEIAVMFVTGLLAMSTDHWFASKKKAKGQ
ncbi:MAG: hypothetical protein ABI353_21995 [Isosphaeraceae bacterium]